MLRLPYSNALNPLEVFEFEEKDGCLWGNGAYVVAGRILATFARYEWCAEICGIPGGLVGNLPMQYQYGNDDLECRGPAEVALGARRGLELSRLGFIVIGQSQPTDQQVYIDSVFTCHRPAVMAQEDANDCGRLSADLRYILAMSRFMHFLAMRMRDRTCGGYTTTSQYESALNKSLSEYVASSGTGATARQPLLSGTVRLSDNAEHGMWRLVLFAIPGYQLQAPPIALRAALQLPQSPA